MKRFFLVGHTFLLFSNGSPARTFVVEHSLAHERRIHFGNERVGPSRIRSAGILPAPPYPLPVEGASRVSAAFGCRAADSDESEDARHQRRRSVHFDARA